MSRPGTSHVKKPGKSRRPKPRKKPSERAASHVASRAVAGRVAVFARSRTGVGSSETSGRAAPFVAALQAIAVLPAGRDDRMVLALLLAPFLIVGLSLGVERTARHVASRAPHYIEAARPSTSPSAIEAGRHHAALEVPVAPAPALPRLAHVIDPPAPALQRLVHLIDPPAPVLPRLTHVIDPPAPALPRLAHVIDPPAPVLPRLAHLLDPPAPALPRLAHVIDPPAPALPRLAHVIDPPAPALPRLAHMIDPPAPALPRLAHMIDPPAPALPRLAHVIDPPAPVLPRLARLMAPSSLEPLQQCLPKVAAAPQVAPRDPGQFGLALAHAARDQLGTLVIYNAKYVRMSYPMGDVAPLYGVCTDVVVRAYRALGIDLQALIHKARVGSGDRNIDHRRVEVVRRFLARFGESLPVTAFHENYRPGDIVTYYRPQNRASTSHIAIVTDKLGPSGRPMIVHNRGWGPQIEDALFVDKITGHYRFSGLETTARSQTTADRRQVTRR